MICISSSVLARDDEFVLIKRFLNGETSWNLLSLYIGNKSLSVLVPNLDIRSPNDESLMIKAPNDYFLVQLIGSCYGVSFAFLIIAILFCLILQLTKLGYFLNAHLVQKTLTLTQESFGIWVRCGHRWLQGHYYFTIRFKKKSFV